MLAMGMVLQRGAIFSQREFGTEVIIDGWGCSGIRKEFDAEHMLNMNRQRILKSIQEGRKIAAYRNKLVDGT